ncbi:MAG TPA: hypothetical protein VL361_04965 [Candidatus Limnocylindrales bacterium]|nr:hypothetical protein [Candidatus Limnocylindrales bacterium]
MKTAQTLRVHNAMVTDQMQTDANQLRTSLNLGRKLCLRVHEDRNAVAFHYIESGAANGFQPGTRLYFSVA